MLRIRERSIVFDKKFKLYFLIKKFMIIFDEISCVQSWPGFRMGRKGPYFGKTNTTITQNILLPLILSLDIYVVLCSPISMVAGCGPVKGHFLFFYPISFINLPMLCLHTSYFPYWPHSGA